MRGSELYDRVTHALPADELPDEELRVDEVTRTVLAALAARLTKDEAQALASELPRSLAAWVNEHSATLTDAGRESFLEDLAVRLDLDDSAAEAVARAVLGAVRTWLDQDAGVHAEEILEQLPSDLAALFRP